MIKLLSERMIYSKDEYYFSSIESNTIFSLNKNTKRIDIKVVIQNEELFENRLFGGILKYKDGFLLIPANGKHIILLDNDFRNETIIKSFDSNGSLKFMSGTVYKDKLFMFNHEYKGIMCIDLNNYSEIILDDIQEDFFFDCFVEDENVLLPSCNSNHVYNLNMDSLKIDQFKVGSGNYNVIEKYKNDYYLAPRNSNTLTIWKNKREVSIIPIPFCNVIGIIKIEDNIYLPSNIQGNSLKIDGRGDITGWRQEERFILSKRINDNEYVLMNDKAILYIVDMTSGNIEKKQMELPNDLIVKSVKKHFSMRENKMLYESNYNTLNNYLSYM